MWHLFISWWFVFLEITKLEIFRFCKKKGKWKIKFVYLSTGGASVQGRFFLRIWNAVKTNNCLPPHNEQLKNVADCWFSEIVILFQRLVIRHGLVVVGVVSTVINRTGYVGGDVNHCAHILHANCHILDWLMECLSYSLASNLDFLGNEQISAGVSQFD
jgi:hypothetical protein